MWNLVYKKELNIKKTDPHFKIKTICILKYNINKAGFYQVRKLSAAQNILYINTSKTAANTFVASTLDCGNSPLYGFPKLNNLQNSTKYCSKSLSSRLENLIGSAWLQSRICTDYNWKQKIKYKTLVLAWKANHGRDLSYLIELLNKQINSYRTRSTQCLLHIPPYLVTCADRAFSKATLFYGTIFHISYTIKTQLFQE